MSFRRAARAVTAYYDRLLVPSGITVNQYSLLINLSRAAPCSAASLSHAMGLERTTLVRNLKPLMGAGMIRDLAEEGERDRKLTLTPAGAKTLKTAQALWKKAQAGLKKQLGRENCAKLMNAAAQLEKI